MNLEMIKALILIFVFFIYLLLGEGIRSILPSKPELARKSVHFLSGCTALSFPYFIESHWTVLFLAAVFTAVFILTRKGKFLKSIHDVGRRSYGTLYFPISIYILFLLGHDKPNLYFISVLVMTVSDTLAAVLGGRYGSIKYEVEGNLKSLEGSFVFFFGTFLCIHIPLLLMAQINRLDCILIALVIAVLVTGFEAISISGTDNIFVPLGTYFILTKMASQPLAMTVDALWKLFVMIGLTIFVSLKNRLLRTSALIGMVLLNYMAWVLCNFFWFLPLLLAQVMLYFLALYFARRIEQEITGYQIVVILYSSIIPVIFIFMSNIINDYHIFFMPFVSSVVNQIAGITYFFVSIMKDDNNGLIAGLKRRKCLAIIVCGTVSSLFIAAFPLLFYTDTLRFQSFFILIIGVLTALFIFDLLMVKYNLNERREMRQKIRLLSVALGTAVVLIAQTLERL